MAGIFRGQGGSIARALLPALLFVAFVNSGVRAQLYEQPELVVDPGMHTARINRLAVDAAGSIAATGSFDKTVRVWGCEPKLCAQAARCCEPWRALSLAAARFCLSLSQ